MPMYQYCSSNLLIHFCAVLYIDFLFVRHTMYNEFTMQWHFLLNIFLNFCRFWFGIKIILLLGGLINVQIDYQ